MHTAGKSSRMQKDASPNQPEHHTCECLSLSLASLSMPYLYPISRAGMFIRLPNFDIDVLAADER